ncbi:MAG: NHL repeat-containing protein [Bacteroidetes bacterium]|nr:NHL repeat-containing protein [Bacteroidota bacterium]
MKYILQFKRQNIAITIALVLLFMGSLSLQVSAQKYVTVSGGGNTDGSTWTDALDNAGFRTALQNATAGDEFWLAEGTYIPDNVRDSSFRIPNGVKIYGGFSATDTLWSQRNWKKNITILSGDIGSQNVSSDNCYHVLLTYHTDTSSVVDGFTISDGNANGNGNLRNHGAGFLNDGGNSGNASSVTVRNCHFKDNKASGDGGGFTDYGSLDGYVASLIINCVFEGNSGGNGGGLYAAGYNGNNTGTSYTTAINCVFVNNTCNSLGGGAHAHINGGQLSLINCTFTENSSGGGSGSAYYDYKGNTSIVNCIFHNNTGTDIGKSASNANVEVNNSIVQGGFSVGNNIINENPFFVDSNNYIGNDGLWGTDDDGLHVSEGSAAINNGLNDSVPAYITEDFNNVARIKDGKVEIGAYESDYACNEITISTAYTNICKGTVTTFKAQVVSKGGFTPAYQWYRNGSKTGGNSSTFSTGSLSDGDEVYCEVKNSLACYYPNGPVSNTIIMHVLSAPASTLTGNACLGSTLTTTNTTNASKIKWISGGNTLYTATRKPIGTGTTEAGDASGNAGSDSTKFDLAVSVLVDDNGNAYVADMNNNRIQKWPQGYNYAITVAGDANGASGTDSNLLTEPTGIALDQAGNLYIADAQNNRVQKWAQGATYGVTVAGDKNGTAGTDSAHLKSPANIFVDVLGNIYITDNLNHRVQRWAPGATYGVTVAGDPSGTSGTSASLLKEPVGIYVDKDSNVYVSENGNHRVQKWAARATSGVTIAGDANGNAGNDSISLNGPGGIKNLLIALLLPILLVLILQL